MNSQKHKHYKGQHQRMSSPRISAAAKFHNLTVDSDSETSSSSASSSDHEDESKEIIGFIQQELSRRVEGSAKRYNSIMDAQLASEQQESISHSLLVFYHSNTLRSLFDALDASYKDDIEVADENTKIKMEQLLTMAKTRLETLVNVQFNEIYVRKSENSQQSQNVVKKIEVFLSEAETLYDENAERFMMQQKSRREIETAHVIWVEEAIQLFDQLLADNSLRNMDIWRTELIQRLNERLEDFLDEYSQKLASLQEIKHEGAQNQKTAVQQQPLNLQQSFQQSELKRTQQLEKIKQEHQEILKSAKNPSAKLEKAEPSVLSVNTLKQAPFQSTDIMTEIPKAPSKPFKTEPSVSLRRPEEVKPEIPKKLEQPKVQVPLQPSIKQTPKLPQNSNPSRPILQPVEPWKQNQTQPHPPLNQSQNFEPRPIISQPSVWRSVPAIGSNSVIPPVEPWQPTRPKLLSHQNSTPIPTISKEVQLHEGASKQPLYSTAASKSNDKLPNIQIGSWRSNYTSVVPQNNNKMSLKPKKTQHVQLTSYKSTGEQNEPQQLLQEPTKSLVVQKHFEVKDNVNGIKGPIQAQEIPPLAAPRKPNGHQTTLEAPVKQIIHGPIDVTRTPMPMQTSGQKPQSPAVAKSVVVTSTKSLTLEGTPLKEPRQAASQAVAHQLLKQSLSHPQQPTHVKSEPKAAPVESVSKHPQVTIAKELEPKQPTHNPQPVKPAFFEATAQLPARQAYDNQQSDQHISIVAVPSPSVEVKPTVAPAVPLTMPRQLSGSIKYQATQPLVRQIPVLPDLKSTEQPPMETQQPLLPQKSVEILESEAPEQPLERQHSVRIKVPYQPPQPIMSQQSAQDLAPPQPSHPTTLSEAPKPPTPELQKPTKATRTSKIQKSKSKSRHPILTSPISEQELDAGIIFTERSIIVGAYQHQQQSGTEPGFQQIISLTPEICFYKNNVILIGEEASPYNDNDGGHRYFNIFNLITDTSLETKDTLPFIFEFQFDLQNLKFTLCTHKIIALFLHTLLAKIATDHSIRIRKLVMTTSFLATSAVKERLRESARIAGITEIRFFSSLLTTAVSTLDKKKGSYAMVSQQGKYVFVLDIQSASFSMGIVVISRGSIVVKKPYGSDNLAEYLDPNFVHWHGSLCEGENITPPSKKNVLHMYEKAITYISKDIQNNTLDSVVTNGSKYPLIEEMVQSILMRKFTVLNATTVVGNSLLGASLLATSIFNTETSSSLNSILPSGIQIRDSSRSDLGLTTKITGERKKRFPFMGTEFVGEACVLRQVYNIPVPFDSSRPVLISIQFDELYGDRIFQVCRHQLTFTFGRKHFERKLIDYISGKEFKLEIEVLGDADGVYTLKTSCLSNFPLEFVMHRMDTNCTCKGNFSEAAERKDYLDYDRVIELLGRAGVEI